MLSDKDLKNICESNGGEWWHTYYRVCFVPDKESMNRVLKDLLLRRNELTNPLVIEMKIPLEEVENYVEHYVYISKKKIQYGARITRTLLDINTIYSKMLNENPYPEKCSIWYDEDYNLMADCSKSQSEDISKLKGESDVEKVIRNIFDDFEKNEREVSNMMKKIESKLESMI